MVETLKTDDYQVPLFGTLVKKKIFAPMGIIMTHSIDTIHHSENYELKHRPSRRLLFHVVMFIFHSIFLIHRILLFIYWIRNEIYFCKYGERQSAHNTPNAQHPQEESAYSKQN